MIMQRRRDERTMTSARDPAAESISTSRHPLLRKGRAGLNVATGQFEIVFSIPADDALPLIERLRLSNASTPIRLWIDADGDVLAQIDQCESGAARATFTVTADVETPASARPEMPRLVVADFVINPGRHEVLYKGKPTPKLTYTEFGILYLLARHPGWVFNRNQIIEGVRGANYPVTDRAVDVQVAGLRRKLGEGAEWIETVRGIGYRFRD